ncbi:lung seven transmembrane receptor-domain-containing protein [Desarmillaria tabescens]|uniref:Lung seven transmembrane receptor-domain-containing protein n=1 Tax=Armillaria tabescens TaxID=1929756 RepID=A0AA39TQ02_ARMTA|nr:lung seven transmembrane receptor-domain-containing protein [Desarmillaria tabescens]KAK0466467.1 lung seven transmembrane receptor-domain-containing protein [Desarmillaria tabescens]
MAVFSHPFILLFPWLFLTTSVLSYQVPVVDTDYSRQICSGMWGSQSTYINVSFDATSQGNVAMVVYEWADAEYLGKVTSPADALLPQKTYVCTSSAVVGGFCTASELGRFILDLPSGKSINDTSFWSARVQLPWTSDTNSTSTSAEFWADAPGGVPTPPPSADDEYTTPWRRSLRVRDSLNPSPNGIHMYVEPIQYLVRKTGYYCVAIVPVTVRNSASSGSSARAPTDVPYHPSYNGLVFFQNTFDGQLPATDYPKVTFYFVMFLVYATFAGAWGWLCYKHVQELLPIQYYLSGLVGLLVIEMVANWAYYRYLNAHGKSTASTVFLIVVAILDAGRNSMSFFMLLVVSLGLSVVRESLGRTMIKCQILAGAHFIFGILYAVGIVELELESTSALVLLLFVIPLAFTLSGFLLWIMYSLNATIAQLKARKQRYKLLMFERLYRILLLTVVVIAIFFIVSSFSFSGRLAEDYAAKSWKVRWWLLDGWLALLYLAAFVTIAYLWRPSENNRRYVSFFAYESMSDEIAQDEEDAEDYDLEALESRTRAREDDEATLVGGTRAVGGVTEDSVVFEIGDEEGASDDEDSPTKKRAGRRSTDSHGREDERRGLMSGG